MDSPQPGVSTVTKDALRDQLRAARKRRPLDAVAAFSVAVADVAMGWSEVRRAATVAAYVSVGSEPGTGHLLDALVAAGKRVIIPVVLPGRDLDWAPYTGPSDLVPAFRGLLEPTADRLGVDGVGTADVVLAPGMAVSPIGERLGQGGGFYDRVLSRIPGTPVAVVLYDDEVGLDVPTEPHDARVDFALTAGGVVPLGVIPG